MFDSLLNRFRGAFLGALLGEAIGISYLTGHSTEVEPFQAGWNASKLGRLQPPTDALLSWSRLMLAQTEQLLQPGLERSEWAASAAPVRFTGMAELAVAMLPMALFYHDQPAVFQAALEQDVANLHLIEGAVVVGQTCSLILRERLLPDRLIPQLVADLDLSNALGSDALLVPQLRQVQTWIEQPPTLTTVSQWVEQQRIMQLGLDGLPIALALYSFLSSPEDFRLSLLRLVQISYLSPTMGAIAGTIVGAVSGLYNGLVGLPLAWRQQFWSDASAGLQAGRVDSEAEVLQSAEHLLAVWSGAEQPVRWLNQPHFANITAAPRVIR